MPSRKERDTLGTLKVDGSAYYGVNTQRALENFCISGLRLPKRFMHTYAMIKRSAALSNMLDGLLDKRRGKAIIRACDEVIAGKLDGQFVIDAFQAGAGTSTNMNVNEVIANRAIELLGGRKGDYGIVHPNDHVNMSQSTNDTFHAAVHISAHIGIVKRLVPALKGLEKALDKKSEEFSKIVKVGRTHLEDAVPITLGQEFSGYAYSANVSVHRLLIAAKEIAYIPIGGTAVGTGINTTANYKRNVIREINDYCGYRFKPSKNVFFEMKDQASEAFASAAIRDAAISVMMIADDLRLLGSGPMSGFGDIILPAVQAGSSIMPGKVNPSIAEMADMACMEVMGNDSVICNAAQKGQLELNVFMPIIAYKLLESIEILANAANALNVKCVGGIKANEKLLRERLYKNPEIATIFAPEIGYDKSAALVKESVSSGRSVVDIAIERKLISKKRIDELLGASSLTRPNLKPKRR